MEEITKKCTKCGRVLPLSKFPRNKQGKDGHINQCKECKNAYHKEWIKAKRKAERENRPKEKIKPQLNKYYHLVDPETLEVVQVVSTVELLDMLGLKAISSLNNHNTVNGLLISEP